MIGLKVIRRVKVGGGGGGGSGAIPAGVFTYHLYKDEAFNRAISQAQQNLASPSGIYHLQREELLVSLPLTDEKIPETIAPTDKQQLAKLSFKNSALERGTVTLHQKDVVPFQFSEYDLEGKLPQTVFRQLRLAPLLPHEVEGAIEVLQGSPQVMDEIVDGYSSESKETQELYWKHTKQLLATVQVQIKENIDKKEREIMKKMQSNYYVSNTQTQLEEEWAALAMRFHCAICQDVKAAPFLCTCRCKADYCYECLENYKNSAQVEDDSVEIFPHCPVCRDVIPSSSHNKSLDNFIKEEVDKFPDCENKRDWERRRQVYYDQEKLKEMKSLKEEEDKEMNAGFKNIAVAIAVSVIFCIMANREILFN